MSLSIQRTALILVVSRLIVVVMISALLANQSFLNMQGIDAFSGQVEEKSTNLGDFLLSDGVNIGGTYTDTSIGDEQYGFKMSFWDILKGGAVGWFPTSWGTNNIEKMFMYILNFVGMVLTLLAAFEMFQIMWGKKTT